MCTTKEKVCRVDIQRRMYVHEASSGYKEESTGLMKRWFSLFELPAGKSRGEYLSVTLSENIFKNLTSVDIEAWTLPDHGRIPSR